MPPAIREGIDAESEFAVFSSAWDYIQGLLGEKPELEVFLRNYDLERRKLTPPVAQSRLFYEAELVVDLGPSLEVTCPLF